MTAHEVRKSGMGNVYVTCAVTFLFAVLLAAACAPLIGRGWNEVHLDQRYEGPSPFHLLGTDNAGADAASRLIYASRVAVIVGGLSAGVSLLIGIVAGLGMGYFGGWVDLIGMRVIELFMATPRLFLVIAVVVFLPARSSGVSLAALVGVIGMTGWMRPARLMRAETLRVRSEDYVWAARAMGLSRRSILARHILPNGIAPVLVDGGFMIASAILMETNLSFLGLGVQAPTPSWGSMLAQAIDHSTGDVYWWLAIGPGVMILLTVLSCHGIAEGMRVRLSRRDEH